MKRSLVKSRFVLSSFLVVAGFIFLGATLPDEGMWTFDNPPLKLLKAFPAFCFFSPFFWRWRAAVCGLFQWHREYLPRN